MWTFRKFSEELSRLHFTYHSMLSPVPDRGVSFRILRGVILDDLAPLKERIYLIMDRRRSGDSRRDLRIELHRLLKSYNWIRRNPINLVPPSKEFWREGRNQLTFDPESRITSCDGFPVAYALNKGWHDLAVTQEIANHPWVTWELYAELFFSGKRFFPNEGRIPAKVDLGSAFDSFLRRENPEKKGGK